MKTTLHAAVLLLITTAASLGNRSENQMPGRVFHLQFIEAKGRVF